MVEYFGHIFSTPALTLKLFIILHIDFSDVTIIKLIPFVSILDIAIIMAATSLSTMDHHSSEPILSNYTRIKIFRLTVNSFIFPSGQTCDCVGFHIKFSREFKVIVKFNGSISFKIIIKPFKLNYKDGRQFLNTKPFYSIYFLVTSFTIICVFCSSSSPFVYSAKLSIKLL